MKTFLILLFWMSIPIQTNAKGMHQIGIDSSTKLGSKQTITQNDTVWAEFPGGLDSFKLYLEKNLNINPESYRGIFLICIITFTVHIDGTVSDCIVSNSSGNSIIDEKCKALLLSIPKFTPASVKGIPIKSTATIPFTFDGQ